MLNDPHTALESIAHLMDALNCGASLLDRSGTIVQVNGRLCAMMKLPREQIVGRSVIDLYRTEEDRAKIRESLDRFDERVEREFFLPLPDGTHLPIISSARPLPAPLQDYRIVTMIDISRQKQAEQSLKEQYEFVVQMSDTVLQQAMELKRYSQQLEDRVRERTAQLHEAQMDAIVMLAVASEAKDQDTGRHVKRIERYAQELAHHMGYSTCEAEAIGYSAILHDIGKIHVPDDILQKPGPLDDAERARMQEHTIAGERIISPHAFFERARRIARSHHENWDGSGYPDKTARDKIPIEARIVHLIDVFDALTHERVYKKAWERGRAVEAIVADRGKMYDPEVVRAFEAGIQAGAFRDSAI